jgi:hypothetical protein
VSLPSPAACFSSSYAEARKAFLEACTRGGGAHSEWLHPLRGPDGGRLALDAARFGPPDAGRILFVASGTHGIEGFCGSGIQVFLLARGIARSLPADVALVLVHAVNPWGFAWLRRVNEDNVDVNRNFLDHSAPHPENPDYELLFDVLNPAKLDARTVGATHEALRELTQSKGAAAVYRALSGGQYAHPGGVQFGGTSPVWSNTTLRQAWARHAGKAVLAVNLDLHSGLGPRGVGLVLQTAREQALDGRLARAWWPEVLRAEPAQGSDAALVSGLIGPAFVASRAPAAGVGVVLEFGTLEMARVMEAVQADNWLAQHGERASETGRAIERQMREAFFLEDEEWMEKVCARAQEVVERTLTGMAAFTPEQPA